MHVIQKACSFDNRRTHETRVSKLDRADVYDQ